MNSDRVSGSATSRYFSMNLPIDAESLGSPEVEAVTALRKADGTPSIGLDFDGEGIALSHRGEIYIASEGRTGLFQTEIRRYAQDGELLGQLPVEERCLVAPAGSGVSNLVFESMALSPSGRSLFTANETPLSVDGETAGREGRIRIVRYEVRGFGGFAPVAEFFYLMDPARNATGTLEVGVAEIVALSDSDLLVLERGFGRSGKHDPDFQHFA